MAKIKKEELVIEEVVIPSELLIQATEKEELELIVELMNKYGVSRLGQVEVKLSQLK